MSVINVFDHQTARFERGSRENVLRMAKAALRSASRASYRHRMAIAAVVGAILAMGGLYTLLVDEAETPKPVAASLAKTAPAIGWAAVVKPFPVFSLEAPEFARSVKTLSVRRHAPGGGREDALSFGAIAGNEPYLRLVIHQVGAEGAPTQTFFVESARRAADIGAALDNLGKSAALATRFGDAEWAEAKIALPAAQGNAQNAPAGVVREGCATFRLGVEAPGLRIFGLACGSDGATFTRKQLACIVGRLDLVGAGEDPALRDFFTRAELARDTTCAAMRDRRPARAASRAENPDKSDLSPVRASERR